MNNEIFSIPGDSKKAPLEYAKIRELTKDCKTLEELISILIEGNYKLQLFADPEHGLPPQLSIVVYNGPRDIPGASQTRGHIDTIFRFNLLELVTKYQAEELKPEVVVDPLSQGMMIKEKTFMKRNRKLKIRIDRRSQEQICPPSSLISIIVSYLISGLSVVELLPCTLRYTDPLRRDVFGPGIKLIAQCIDLHREEVCWIEEMAVKLFELRDYCELRNSVVH